MVSKTKDFIIDPVKVDLFTTVIQSPEHMRDWIYEFFDIWIPLGHTDPDSNSSPIEAMYEAYCAYRDDTVLDVSGYIWMSSRDSGKTLCGSILNVMLLVHFKSQVAHLAAVKKQAEKCIQYCNTFVRKIKPYLDAIGRKVISDSRSKIQILNEDDSISYIDVIVANLAGGNSEHVPVCSFDELDCLSAQGVIGYNEAKLIPTRYKNKGPLTIKYSTRKFAFGVFEKEIQDIARTKEKLLRWNILDITEYCKPERHKPELPRITKYIRKNLPLTQLTEEEYLRLPEKDKLNFDLVEAHTGCGNCPLLPICKTTLSQRSPKDYGGLFKNIDFTIRQFRTISDDMAEAQLLCWKPSQSGLVYPRFDDIGNTLTLAEACALLDIPVTPKTDMFAAIKDFIKNNGIKTYASIDWGFRHKTAITVHAIMPSGDWWLLDTQAIAGLEFSEILELAMKVRDEYLINMWFPDTAQPMFIKTFKKNKMPCKDFKKDVMGGIEAVRTQVLDASGRRRLKVLRHDRNEELIKGMKIHHFVLDLLGNPTQEPDDEEYADMCFPKDTDIITLDGVKTIDQISCSDKVLTHTGVFRQVLNTMSREYEGPLRTLDLAGRKNLESTPNHPILAIEMKRSCDIEHSRKLTGQRRPVTEPTWVPSECLSPPNPATRKIKNIYSIHCPLIAIRRDITVNFQTMLPSYKLKNGKLYPFEKQVGKFKGLPVRAFPAQLSIDTDFAFTIGYFAAEGSVGNHLTQISFAGHSKEANVHTLLANFAKRIGGSHCFTYTKDNSKKECFNHRGLAVYFKRFKSFKEKTIPFELLELPDEELFYLLAGYFFGDGCFTEINHCYLSAGTISKNIAHFVYLGLVKLGYRAMMTKAKRAGRWGGFGENGRVSSDIYNINCSGESAIRFVEKIRSYQDLAFVYLDKTINQKIPKSSSFRTTMLETGYYSNVQAKCSSREYSGRVYNFEVDTDHSYVANLCSVHNCDTIRYTAQNLFKPKSKNYVAQDEVKSQTPFQELTAAHLDTRPDPSSFIVDSDLLTDFGA